jgi:hypothetical protein
MVIKCKLADIYSTLLLRELNVFKFAFTGLIIQIKRTADNN